jgi:carnosine N-methyltransferase
VHAFERMSMCAGDFCLVYGDPKRRGSFDSVLTVFFIDTAPNIVRYIEAIHNCLKKDGIWINNGPLLWHGEDRKIATTHDDSHDHDTNEKDTDTNGNGDKGIAEPGSVELTNEEVLLLVEALGFVVLKQEILAGPRGGGHISPPNSMLQNQYQLSHFVARKSG